MKNAHGDVVGMVDSGNNLIQEYRYDAFGNQIDRDEADSNPFRYSGEYWDGETENIYLRARMYDPGAGRFTSEDPAKDGLNWYSYCAGNPVMFVDPWGLVDYIYYGKSQEDSAEGSEKQLIESGAEKPIKIYVETPEQFIEAWENMGTDSEGNDVTIDRVIIHLHGAPTHIYSSNGEIIYASDLHLREGKSINIILLTACSTGDMNYEDNFAIQLLKTQNVNRVIAPDGLGYFYTKYDVKSEYFVGENEKDIKREGNGFVLYQMVRGQLYITTQLTKNDEPNKITQLLKKGMLYSFYNEQYYFIRETNKENLNMNQIQQLLIGK